MAARQHRRDVNVLLFGKSGAGKSTLGNLLIQNENFFKVTRGPAAVGEAAKGSCLVDINGDRFKMNIFDMPGLAEADREDCENLDEIIDCIMDIIESGEPVIHVMIYVLSAADRFTKDDANIFKYFADEGRNFWSHVMLVITSGQRYGETDEERHALLNHSLQAPRCSQHLKSLIEKIGKPRIVITESKDNNDEIQVKRIKLCQMIQELSCTNDEGCIYDVLLRAKRSLTRSLTPALAREEIRHNVRREIEERRGKCFPGNSTVITKNGVKFMHQINPGDEVLAITPGGSTIFSEVLTFLHYEPKTFATYMTIQTTSGTLLHVSSNHLVFSVTPDVATFKSKAVMASCIKPGDYILEIKSPSSQIQSTQVTSINTVHKLGVYAPMTQCGTIVVDCSVASCYASYPSHTVAHAVMVPLRIYYNITKRHRHGLPVTEGVNSYAAFLYKLVY